MLHSARRLLPGPQPLGAAGGPACGQRTGRSGAAGACLAVRLRRVALVVIEALWPMAEAGLPATRGAAAGIGAGAGRHGRGTGLGSMDMDTYARHLIEFVRQHEVWAAPLVFALAFGESLAFLSLVLPAWAALVGIGALTGASGLPFWPLWIAGALGAALGDWLSYWIGTHLGGTVIHLWPLSRHPDLLPQGEAFVKKWGVASIFLGRFFGPLRASVPLVAGMCAMPFWPFQYANVSSALVWAAVLLTLGDTGAKILHWFWR